MLKWSCPLQNKARLRQTINEKRAAFGDVARNNAAQQALDFFTKSPLFIKNNNIASYLARREEFDCSPIIKALWQANKNCYLPILSEKEGHLDFVRYQEQDGLQLNRFRILEPTGTEKISPEKLDVVLLPLVAFDLKGHRLGVGGGYYDRTFEFVLKDKLTKPMLIGVGYEFQHVKQLPFDEWDVSLNGILTEKKLIIF